jgi:hypothetical protein
VYDLLGKTEAARADRATSERASALDQELAEAKEFLNSLRVNDVTLNVSANGRDLEYAGKSPMQRETLDTMRRLKPQLLQILARD